MLGAMSFVLAAVAVVVVIEMVAERTGLPTAALLTLAGLGYALLPGPNLTVAPHVVLSLILPPLLYSAALNSSLIAIRRSLRPIISLSVVLVLLTALLTGALLHALVPEVTLAAGIALGAAVSPPDPVASLAVGRRAALPRRLITLIEGEGLLNDATALTTLTIAVAAVESGGFSPGWAVLRFVGAAAGGVFAGLVVATVVRLTRRWVHEPVLVNTISLATPFAAYLLGEETHSSAVLAVVLAGLLVGHDTPRALSGGSRLQTRAVWRLVDFLLESFVFVLIGQQLPVVVRGLSGIGAGRLAVAAACTLGGVLLIRPAWLTLTQLLPARLGLRLGGERGASADGERPLTWREVVALSWAGTRGVITLTSVLILPVSLDDGRAFPERDLLIFCAYLVVVVTLVGQGVTFAPLVARLRLPGDQDRTHVHRRARAAAARAALAELDAIAAQEQLDPRLTELIRERLQRRRTILDHDDEDAVVDVAAVAAAVRAERRVTQAQRAEVVRWRHLGRLGDDSVRLLQAELDHEESALITRISG